MRYSFCAACGAELGPSEPFQAQHCDRCGTWHYHNSKPCAAALVIEDGKVLLGKRGIEPYKGYWDVPGGFLEAGEHPEEGTKRELLEETGLEIRILGLIGFYMDRYGADGVWLINFYYAAERTGGELRAMDDVEELRWFSPDELPKEFGFAHQYQLMDDLREWLQAR